MDAAMQDRVPCETTAPPSGDGWTDDAALALLAACLRPRTDAGRVSAIASAARTPFDPERLVDLVHRHRVAGFVGEGLEAAGMTLPATAAARLAGQVRAARLLGLRNAGEEVRVGAALAAAGIDAIFLKGATLGLLVHGSLVRKTSWDIDVLVGRDRLEAAGAVLADLGYHLSILGGVSDPVQVRRFLAAHKESEWRHATRGTVVELHTELSDNRAAITGIGLGSPRTGVTPMAGTTLQTLAPAPLFAYLAFHGTTHLWARLKWLADVAALLHGADIVALYDAAVALGAGRTPGVAIVLAHEVLGLAVPADLLATIRRDPVTRRLLRVSYDAIAVDEAADGGVIRSITHSIKLARLLPGFAHVRGAVHAFFHKPYRPLHLRAPGWMLPGVILMMLPTRLFHHARIRRQPGGKTASRP